MEQAHSKKVLSILILAALVVFILAVAGILKAPGISGSSGTVVFSNLGKGENIFVDNERIAPESIGASGNVVVAAGNRDLLVSEDHYWPWLKQVSVESGQTVTVDPFLIPEDPVQETIGGDNPEHDALEAAIEKQMVPSEPSVLVSPDGNVTIWQDGERLLGRWIGTGAPAPYFCTTDCGRDVVVLSSTHAIQAVSFLGDRNDVLIVASGSDVSALELDRRPVQNFQPIYHGSAPSFALVRGELFVLDGGLLYHISIFQ